MDEDWSTKKKTSVCCVTVMKRCCVYLMRFDGSGQLWRQEDIRILGRVVQVHQDSAPCIRMVQGVIDMSATRLTFFFLVGGFTADMDKGVVLPRAQVDHICTGARRGKKINNISL